MSGGGQFLTVRARKRDGDRENERRQRCETSSRPETSEIIVQKGSKYAGGMPEISYFAAYDFESFGEDRAIAILYR